MADRLVRLLTRMAVATMGIGMATTVLLTGCSDGGRSAAGSDRDRSAVIQDLRNIDTCALYGDAQTVAGKTMTVQGPTSLLRCDAQIGDPDQDVSVTLAVTVAPANPAPEEPWVKHRTIDGVDVSQASSWDAPNAPPREQVVSSSCSFTARYPDDAQIMVIVTAHPDTDACAIGEEVIRTAVREYAKHPARGSTAFPTTVLTGADPCAAVQRLRPAHRVDVDTQSSSPDTCAFSMDNSPMVTVSFDYQNPAWMNGSPDRFDLDAHQVAGDAARGVFDVLVGPHFQVADKTLVPLVTIVDLSLDMNRIRMIAQAVADQY